MKKVLFLICLVVALSAAKAAEKKPEPPPLNPAWYGEHTMALVNQGSRIFAVNMPTYEKPSDVQIVYKIDNKDVAFLSMVRDLDLVTIKARPFNIEHLIRGDEIEVIADVYEGDFANGGSILYEGVSLVFGEKLYARELADLQAASQWQEYDYVDIKENERLYIHKLTQKPSFNHVMFIEMRGACLSKFKTSSRVPPLNELIYKFNNCGGMKPLYYDELRYQE